MKTVQVHLVIWMTLAVFLDKRKAFDTINHEILFKKLEHYGVHGTELKWFTCYLRDRKQYAVVGTIKSQLGCISEECLKAHVLDLSCF